ncbi:12098_t:CDS:1, partial [Gigaspora margarita]
ATKELKEETKSNEQEEKKTEIIRNKGMPMKDIDGHDEKEEGCQEGRIHLYHILDKLIL